MSEETGRGAAARALAEVAERLAREMEDGNWVYADRSARLCLSIASKILQRVKAVQDLINDGYATAEVDRALRPKN